MASTVSITVPKEYGYVVLSATVTFALSFWHGTRVGSYRKAAGPHCTYPAPYAVPTDPKNPRTSLTKEEYLFNCAQRAHANYLENHGTLVPALLIAGLEYPVLAASLGLGWSVSRFVYATGYTRRDKDRGQGRLYGLFFWPLQFTLIGLAGKVGWDMLV